MYVHDTHFNGFVHDLVYYLHLRFYDSHDMLSGFFVWVSVTVIFMMKALLRSGILGSGQKVLQKQIYIVRVVKVREFLGGVMKATDWFMRLFSCFMACYWVLVSYIGI